MTAGILAVCGIASIFVKNIFVAVFFLGIEFLTMLTSYFAARKKWIGE